MQQLITLHKVHADNVAKKSKSVQAVLPQQQQSCSTLSGFEVCLPEGCMSEKNRKEAADLSEQLFICCYIHHESVITARQIKSSEYQSSSSKLVHSHSGGACLFCQDSKQS